MAENPFKIRFKITCRSDSSADLLRRFWIIAGLRDFPSPLYYISGDCTGSQWNRPEAFGPDSFHGEERRTDHHAGIRV
jgi:hypothetical protein